MYSVAVTDVVVAGADVHVAADAVALAAHDERHLAVRLQAHEPVDDVHAHVLERARPLDVALLVEARLELDEAPRPPCPPPRPPCSAATIGRVLADAVQRHLDGEHVRVARRLLEERDDRLERVVRVVQQDVALADGGEDVALVRRRRSSIGRAPGRTARTSGPGGRSGERRPRSLMPSGGSSGTTSSASILRFSTRMSRMYSGMSGSTVMRTTEPKRRRRTPCSIDLEQVVGLELLDDHLGVARDAERVGRDDVQAREQRAEVRRHELLEPDEAVLARRLRAAARLPGTTPRRAAAARAGSSRARTVPRRPVRARRPRGSCSGSRCAGTACPGRRRAA